MREMEFSLDISAVVSEIQFRPYMIETAYLYCSLIIDKPLLGISTPIACLSIEILLKSFNAKVTSDAGSLSERYRFSPSSKVDPHNLVEIADLLPADVRSYLLSEQGEEKLHQHQKAFCDSRYLYESQARQHTCDSIPKLAVELLCKTVYLYQKLGCSDPFIQNFNVSAAYFSGGSDIIGFLRHP